jgi:Ca2+-binding EF-hand superfamily protein
MKKLIIGTAAMLAGTAVLAQTPAPAPVAPSAPMARPMHDKVMTRAETVEIIRAHFARLDADQDGIISGAEAAARRKHPGGAWQGENAMVRRHDRADPAAAFDRIDANKDGSISRDEFAKAREERIERRMVTRERGEGAKDGREARKHVMRMHGGRGFGGRMIVMADTDKDGRITLAEAEALALRHFDQLDTNRDGQVTPEERRAGRPMIKKMIEEKKTAG